MKLLNVLECVSASPCFMSFLKRELIFVTSCLPVETIYSFKDGSDLESKNLLKEEHILSFRSWLSFGRDAIMEMEKSLPLKVYPYTLKWNDKKPFMSARPFRSFTNCSQNLQYA